MNEIITRLKAKTPLFWVKVRNVAIAVTTGAVAVWTINSTMNLQLSEFVMNVCKYTIAAGAAFGFSAQMTKEDK